MTRSVFVIALGLLCSAGCVPGKPSPQIAQQDQANWRCAGDLNGVWFCADQGKYPPVAQRSSQPAVTNAEPSAEKNPGSAPENISATPPTGDALTALMSTPGDHFALQLVALPERQAVIDYAAELQLAKPLILKSQSNGRVWYLLIEGVYSDHQAAQTALDTLQANHTDLSAWIRPIKGLQQSVDASREN